jgi:hypothetical protein
VVLNEGCELCHGLQFRKQQAHAMSLKHCAFAQSV